MDKNRKAVLYIAGGAIGLIIIVLLLRSVIHNRFISQIPELSDSHSLSQPVKEQISDALENVHRNPSADNLGKLGMVYHSSANYEQAAQCYELAIRRSKSDWIWNYYHGYLNMEMGESEAVIENFNRVIENNPDIDLARYYIGEEYRNLRKNELAEEFFGKIAIPENRSSAAEETTRVDHFPISTYARFQQSRIYFETGRVDLAEKTLREILQANRTFGPAYRLLGNIYSMKGDTSLSVHYSLRASDLFVFFPPVDTLVDRLVLLSRSELYLLKKIDEAERSIYDQWTLRLVNNALQYMPDNKYLISKAINIFLWMDLHEQAVAFTDQHINLFQENFKEMNRMGHLFFLDGLYPQSIEYLTRALVLEPENAEIQKELAVCYWSVGDKQKSYDLLDEIAEKHRDNPDLLADVADILFFTLRESEKATGIITGLKQVAPSNPKVQKVSAGIAEKKGRFQEAITLYESSFRGDPEELNTIKHLGSLLYEQKMWDKTIRHYREALAYHPNDPYFMERLGSLLVMCPDPTLRNNNEAIEYLERAFIHMSSRPTTLVSAGRSLAIVCARLGDNRNAIKTIEQTIDIARLENISPTYQAELENLHKALLAMDN